ncbi:MAG: RDD family protein [Candidatus Hodarchaeota archaeon]
MGVRKEITTEAEFIEQVRSWLPPQVMEEDGWLQELQQNLRAAYKVTSIALPTGERWQKVFREFGTPQRVAEDLLSSQADKLIRASYSRRLLAYLIDMIFANSLLIIAFLLQVIVFDFLLDYYFIPTPVEIIINEITWYGLNLTSFTQAFLMLYFLLVEGAKINFNWNPTSILLHYTILGLVITLNIVSVVGYYGILEAHYGRTIGKRLLRLRVVSETGIRITWQQAVTRNLSKFASQFLILDLFVGWFQKTDRQRALDLISKTLVICDH